MKTIPITNSSDVAVVDDIDYEAAMEYTWCLKASSFRSYVATTIRKPENKFTVLRLHRLIASRMLNGELYSDMDVHHKNHNVLDNRRNELEIIEHKKHGGY